MASNPAGMIVQVSGGGYGEQHREADRQPRAVIVIKTRPEVTWGKIQGATENVGA